MRYSIGTNVRRSNDDEQLVCSVIYVAVIVPRNEPVASQSVRQ